MKADIILLVDSDMEIINDGMFRRMRELLCRENVYGAGYFQSGRWLETHYGTDEPLSPGIGFYMSRPWIPFVMFRAEPVRAVVRTGVSFKHDFVLNDVPQLPIVSRFLWRRFRFPAFRRMPLRALNLFRRRYEGQKPSYVFYDTGARIHDALAQAGFSFADVGPAIPPWSIKHLQGVTRDLLQGHSSDARDASLSEHAVYEKLRNEYGLN
jgi:hypothetical protein